MKQFATNVLVIMCDQLRYDALSCHGNKYISTQNIDGLSQKSIHFENGYTQSPLCGPARHTLATGKYPCQHGVINNVLLPLDGMYTIAHHMKNEGYRTCCIGHMHWQRLESEVDEDKFTDHGYEEYLAINRNYDKLDAETRNQVLWETVQCTQDNTGGPGILNKEDCYGQDVVNETKKKLNEWVSNGEKFLCWTSFDEPHPPFFPPVEYYKEIDQCNLPLPDELPEGTPEAHEEVLKRRKKIWDTFTSYEKRRLKAAYYGMVKQADDYVGQVLSELDRLNLWKNTIVIFTVDHGEQLGDHNLYRKYVMREPSTHIPFMIYHPKYKPGVRKQFVEHVDIFPTICDVVGIDPPHDIEGHSILPLLKEDIWPQDWRDFVFSQVDDHIMIRTNNWKLNIYKGEPGELYNIKDDPKEFFNLIGDEKYCSIIESLADRLNKYHPDIFAKTEKLLKSDRLRKKKKKPNVMLTTVQ